MGRALGGSCVAALLVVACSNDFDGFHFVDDNGIGGGAATVGSGGNGALAGGGSGGSGALIGVGGSGATSSGGTSSGGSGATTTGGTGGCSAAQKLCTGVCVALEDPTFGCSNSGCDPCSLANASTQCFQGQCALASCKGSFANCDADPNNGCETDVSQETAHCGDCGRACSTAKAVQSSCETGVCQHRCEAGAGDCNQPATGSDDGCETDLATADTHCGSCANDCSKQGGGGGFVCGNSRCGCTGNQQCRTAPNVGGNCDGATGLCSCDGSSCQPGEACRRVGPNNVCTCNGSAACSAGETCCQTPSQCVDLQSDANNCGACGASCPSGQTCQSGSCVP
ncbi:MAG: hypothetical protein R3B13_34810 [Polyangiaceae bacterium]